MVHFLSLPTLVALVAIPHRSPPATVCSSKVEESAAWLASRQVHDTGLLVSYDAPESAAWAQNRGYSYSQAVAVVSLLLHGNNSYFNLVDDTVRAMSSRLDVPAYNDGVDGSGRPIYAAPFSWSTTSGTGSPPHRTGAHAWVTYAFALHALTTGSTEHHTVLLALSRWMLVSVLS
eukprot:gene19423-2157_t